MTIAIPVSEKTTRPPEPDLVATWVFAGGMSALGATAIAFQTHLPGLQPAPAGATAAGPVLAGAVLLAAGGTLAARRLRGIGGWILLTFWLAWLFLAHLPRILDAPANITAWVAASQVVTFGLTSLCWAIGAQRWRNLSVGLMLLLFGAVHLTYPAAIAGLLPETFPLRDVWPWITGPVQILAGLAIAVRVMPGLAAAVVSTMFLAWVAVLHAPRLMQAPSDPFEWTFALTALVLAAAVWLAGGDGPSADDHLMVPDQPDGPIDGSAPAGDQDAPRAPGRPRGRRVRPRP